MDMFATFFIVPKLHKFRDLKKQYCNCLCRIIFKILARLYSLNRDGGVQFVSKVIYFMLIFQLSN